MPGTQQQETAYIPYIHHMEETKKRQRITRQATPSSDVTDGGNILLPAPQNLQRRASNGMVRRINAMFPCKGRAAMVNCKHHCTIPGKFRRRKPRTKFCMELPAFLPLRTALLKYARKMAIQLTIYRCVTGDHWNGATTDKKG